MNKVYSSYRNIFGSELPRSCAKEKEEESDE